ncbi:hypothetical protein ACFSTC_11875 [Nonomuraea ferruginea]
MVAQSASAAALWDFGVRPVAVFGPHRLKDGGRDPEVGEVDIAAVESIGNTWGEFNVEKFISVRPDLLVSGMYLKDSLWYVPEESADAIEQVAPTLGVLLGGKKLTEVIERYSRPGRRAGRRPERRAGRRGQVPLRGRECPAQGVRRREAGAEGHGRHGHPPTTCTSRTCPTTPTWPTSRSWASTSSPRPVRRRARAVSGRC